MNLAVNSLMDCLGNMYSLCFLLNCVTMSNKDPHFINPLVKILQKHIQAHLRRKRLQAAGKISREIWQRIVSNARSDATKSSKFW